MHALAFEPATAAAWIAWAIAAAAVFAVVYALVTDEREPTIVLAWLFVILLIPVLGVVAYFFIGRDFRRAGRTEHSEAARASGSPAAAGAGPLGTLEQRIEATGRREGGAVPLPAEDVKLYFAGADKFTDLLADLRLARRYVHLMYLIWEKDRLTAEVTEILLERLRDGVEVNILYDWLSSLPYKKDELRRLAAAGARVVPC